MYLFRLLLAPVVVLPLVRAEAPKQFTLVLKPGAFRHYVETFNRNDVEQKVNYVDNKGAWA